MISLTYNETEVLLQLARGLTTEQIALKVNKSKRTIDGTRSKLLQKFNCRTTVGLLAKALQYGFLNDSLSLFLNNDKLRTQLEYLTLAEGLVLHLLLGDHDRNQIGNELQIEPYEADRYRKKINSKWSIDSPVDLVIKSVQKGYVEIHACRSQLSVENKQELWEAIQNKMASSKQKKYERLYTLEYAFPAYIRQTLTPLQLDILRLRVEGKTNAEIAEECTIRLDYVTRYMHKIRKRLNARTSGDLVKSAISIGVLQVIPGVMRSQVLSAQEVQILVLLARTKSVLEIAQEMKISRQQLAACTKAMKIRWQVYSNEALIAKALVLEEITVDSL